MNFSISEQPTAQELLLKYEEILSWISQNQDKLVHESLMFNSYRNGETFIQNIPSRMVNFMVFAKKRSENIFIYHGYEIEKQKSRFKPVPCIEYREFRVTFNENEPIAINSNKDLIQNISQIPQLLWAQSFNNYQKKSLKDKVYSLSETLRLLKFFNKLPISIQQENIWQSKQSMPLNLNPLKNFSPITPTITVEMIFPQSFPTI